MQLKNNQGFAIVKSEYIERVNGCLRICRKQFWEKSVILLKRKKCLLLSIRMGFWLLALAGSGFLFFPPVLAAENSEIQKEYEDYRQRFQQIQTRADMMSSGFRVIETQIFPIQLETFGEVWVVPAFDRKYMRLALFFTDETGRVVYKTDQLETNSRRRGELKQSTRGIAAISFQDMNGDGLTDIGLITSCMNERGEYTGKLYKVGDVLFQGQGGFYRDYRISDKINRFSMNKSIEMMVAFLRKGYSTEFLYTAATLEELQKKGLHIIEEQHYFQTFEKLGRLEIVPGTYSMSNYDIFMIYLINEQGQVVWRLEPMGDYDNLYALKGVARRDVDGDGQRDIVVLARYSYESTWGEMMIESDYAIYYQRTSGFYADREYKGQYRCGDEDTMEGLIQKARAYWGWQAKEE